MNEAAALQTELMRRPIIAVTGTNGKTTVVRIIRYILGKSLRVVGCTSTEGSFVGTDRILEGDCSGPRSAQILLRDPRVQIAVLETARGGILNGGLAFKHCAVGAVTNISRDHLGLKGVETLEDLAQVKSTVIRSIHPDGIAILNADDPIVARMASVCPGRIIYFSLRSKNEIVRHHIARGGAAVTLEDGRILAESPGRVETIIEVRLSPFLGGGDSPFQIANAMAAAAALWSLGISISEIGLGLGEFRSSPTMNPGRFNVFHCGDLEIVLDYGHNEGAMKALAEVFSNRKHLRTLMVLGLPGDRRNNDLVATIEETVSFAQRYIFYDLENLRGRATGEVPILLRTSLSQGTPSFIASDQHTAIDMGVRLAKPGERLLIIADQTEQALKSLQMLHQELAKLIQCRFP